MGPTNSDMLKIMADEDDLYNRGKKPFPKRGEERLGKDHFRTWEQPTIYSPYATAPPGTNASAFFTGNKTSYTGLQVVRTVGSDEELIKALWEELKLRIDPIRRSTISANDRILLIAEQDTSYGRSFDRRRCCATQR